MLVNTGSSVPNGQNQQASKLDGNELSHSVDWHRLAYMPAHQALTENWVEICVARLRRRDFSQVAMHT